jgi:hypothetical protein
VFVKVGKGVLVGIGVPVEVGVIVAVTVGMITDAGVWRCKAKYTITAPIIRNNASRPMAPGRLNVMDGIRLPWTTMPACTTFSVLVRSAPQTRQRVASSFTRVPQVGHTLVGDVFFSGVILLGSPTKSQDLAHYTSFFCLPGGRGGTREPAMGLHDILCWWISPACIYIFHSVPIAAGIVILTPMLAWKN